MKILAAALIAVVLWGASPVAAKIAVSSLSPMMVAILRTVIGGLVALPLAMLLRIPRPLTGHSGVCSFYPDSVASWPSRCFPLGTCTHRPITHP